MVMRNYELPRVGDSRGITDAVWAVGSAFAAALASQGLFVGAVAFGMFVVVGLDLDETLGVPVYWALLLGAAVTYWALVHFLVKGAGRAMRIPWVIWPAMLLFPAIWGVWWLVAPGRTEFPFGAFIGLIGPIAAWFTLGKRRWSRP